MPNMKAVNDPAWIALQIDGELLTRRITYFSVINHLHFYLQVRLFASLCQDHPNKS